MSSPEGKPSEEEESTSTRDLEKGQQQQQNDESDKPPEAAATTVSAVVVVGLDEGEDPLRWPRWKKVATVLNISLLAGVGQMSSTMVAPAVVSILQEFGAAGNENLGVLVVTVFLIGTALGLLATSGLSEAYGRAPVLYASSACFAAFAAASAAAGSLGQLIAFRLLLGVSAAAPSAVGGGAIGDIFEPHQRGRATAVYGLGMMIGPLVGPVAGGYLAQARGWRWVCWVIATLGGAMFLLTLAVLRETFRPLVLERKLQRLRRSDNTTDNMELTSALPRPCSGRQALVRSLLRPVRLLLFSPVVLLPTLGLAVVFGLFFLMISTMATVFQLRYGFSVGASGLAYLGLSVGLLGGNAVFAVTSDRAYKATKNPTPEVRLAPLSVGAPLAAAGLLLYGWGVERGVHWMLPVAGTAVFALSIIAFIMPVTTYLIEVYGDYAAAPTGVSAFLRSLAGGLLPLCAGRLYGGALGFGWGSTLLAFVALAFAPLPWLFYRNGERLRLRFPPRDY